MRSLKLTDGDLSFDNLGKMAWVENMDRKTQSIKKRLNTVNGNLFYNDAYGLKKIKGKVTKEILESYLYECLIEDFEVSSIEILDFKKDEFKNNSLSVSAIIYLIGSDYLEINLEINI